VTPASAIPLADKPQTARRMGRDKRRNDCGKQEGMSGKRNYLKVLLRILTQRCAILLQDDRDRAGTIEFKGI
jgi:hypothetical protein